MNDREMPVDFVNRLLRRCAAVPAAVVLFASVGASLAQDYPSRPIKLIVPYPAGGPLDVLARTIGNAYRDKYQHGFVVENHPGANTAIAATNCKNAAADGYTVCLLSMSTMSLNPFLYAKLSYDPGDLEPVTNLVFNSHMLVLHRSVPAKTLAELVAYSKANPDKLNYASFGVGGDNHLAMEWIKSRTGLKATHIPFAGAAPAMLALERTDVHMLLVTPGGGNLLNQVREGKLTAVMVSGNKRLAILPEVPSYAEAGLPAFKLRTWFGLFAPRGTPKPAIDTLSRQVAEIIQTPAFQERYLFPNGFEPVGSTPAELGKHIAETREDAAELVKISGVKLN